MQKLRLALRGWNRRREEAKKEFVAKNASWSRGGVAPSPVLSKTTGIDIDGLTVAYRDDSGHFVHYLDVDSGEILDLPNGEQRAAPRYRAVPRRTAQSESADRRAFVDNLAPSRGRDELARAIGVPEAFRRALSNDRSLERAWYSFKNDRAIAAIETWLHGEALK